MWRLIMVGTVIALTGCVQPGARLSDYDSGTVAESISARYAENTISSVETADQAIGEVRAAREAIRNELAVEERACYDRFFTNLCLNKVEERERSAMEQLQRVEVEANAFKRRERAERRGKQVVPPLKMPRVTNPMPGGAAEQNNSAP